MGSGFRGVKTRFHCMEVCFEREEEMMGPGGK